MKMATLSALGIATGLVGVAPAVAADPGCPAGFSSSACVTQIGDRNHAEATVRGQGNGSAIIAAESVSGIKLLGSDLPASDLVMPSLPSGVISQSGNDNVARVEIEGDHNAFHVSQSGDRHMATQTVIGSGNAVAVEQGMGAHDSDNLSSQVQVGSNNVLRTRQLGSFNLAVQAQVPTAEAALLAFAGVSGMESAQLLGRMAGGADHNRILLEQNGDGNEAYLAQIGSANQIALRQQGGAEISIVQFGSGHSIGIEQPAGQRGVQIIQY